MVIKMLNDRSLVLTNPRARLQQRESLVDSLVFLVPATFNDRDLTGLVFSVMWVDPANESHIDILAPDEDLRDDKWIVLRMPVDSKFTKMTGENKVMLMGVNADGDDGSDVVLETGQVKVKVEPVADYFAFTSNEALSAITEKLLNIKRVADELAATQEQANQSSSKDLVYTSNGHINLVTEDGIPMGDGVEVVHYASTSAHDSVDDGVVDLEELDPVGPEEDVTFIDLDG